MNETWENGGKPNFRQDFGSLGPNSEPKFFLPLLDVRNVASYHYIQF